MQRLSIGWFVLVLVAVAGLAVGQETPDEPDEPDVPTPEFPAPEAPTPGSPALPKSPPLPPTDLPEPSVSPGELTPEIWLYRQHREDYMDPELAVRRKAAFRAAQRRRRLAAMRWFGMSNARPRVSSDPLHGEWSPVWTSNTPGRPFQWSGVGWPYFVVRPLILNSPRPY